MELLLIHENKQTNNYYINIYDIISSENSHVFFFQHLAYKTFFFKLESIHS